MQSYLNSLRLNHVNVNNSFFFIIIEEIKTSATVAIGLTVA